MSCLIIPIIWVAGLVSETQHFNGAFAEVHHSGGDSGISGDVAHTSALIAKSKRLSKLAGNTIHDACHGLKLVFSLQSI